MAKKNLLYQQIKEYLIGMINANEDSANYRLPSENQLAKKFGCSRIAVQRAFSSLKAEGYIYSQQGRGTFVQPYRPGAFGYKPAIVSMLVPTLDSQYIQSIVNSTNMTVSRNGMNLVVFTTGDNGLIEDEFIKSSLHIGAKGIIIIPSSFRQLSKEMMQLALTSFPTILIDRFIPGLSLSVVSCDHFMSAYNATKLLISRGHKVIGFVSQPVNYCSALSERLKGFECAMHEARIHTADNHFMFDIYNPAFEKYFSDYIRHVQPTAIICSAKYYGIQIARLFSRMSIKPGYDVELIIYDKEYEDESVLLKDEAFSINQHPDEIGSLASMKLIHLIDGSLKGTTQTLVREDITQFN